MSSILKALRQRIAPELNFLFTIPPAETPLGIDCGWRGPEHALHAFLVARMFGSPASLCTGDFAVLSRALPPLTTLEKEAKHAWCIVGELAPVDLSMNFAFFGDAPQLHAAITGEGPNGDWKISYGTDDSILDGNMEGGNEIIFIERAVPAHSAVELLENPGLFLPPAPVLGGENWAAKYGADIHARITLHCYRCAQGGGRSIRSRESREDALAWIAETYPDAKAEIAKLLAG